MRRELTDLIGSGLLLAALITATLGALAPTTGASASVAHAPASVVSSELDRGESLLSVKGCLACHARNLGPDFAGLAERAASRRPGMSAADYVRESIRAPGAYRVVGYAAEMPDLGLSDDEIDALVAYLLRAR